MPPNPPQEIAGLMIGDYGRDDDGFHNPFLKATFFLGGAHVPGVPSNSYTSLYIGIPDPYTNNYSNALLKSLYNCGSM